MSAIFRRVWLCLLLASFVAPSAGAQLRDLPWPPETDGEPQAAPPTEQAPPAKQARDSEPVAQREKKATTPEKREKPENEEARPTPVSPREPPPSLSRTWRMPREAPELLTEGEAKPRPLLWLFVSLLIVTLLLFVAERARSWITTNVALSRVLGVLAFLLRLSAGGLLIGIDVTCDPKVLVPAYSDSEGVTREFNMNLLRRINRELDADFDAAAFEHVAYYNAEESRVELYLRPRQAQTVRLAKLDYLKTVLPVLLGE